MLSNVLFNNLIGPVSAIISKFVVDKDKQSELAHEISTLAARHMQELNKGQLDINKVEAAHASIFVSGWRPAVGWCSCFGLGYSTILAPFLAIWFQVPEIDTGLLSTVLMAMLGMAGLRSFDKKNNVASR